MVKVYVDEREKASGVPEALSNLGVTVFYKVLEVGDYVVNDVIIERKRVDDLVHSIFDGRFFNQLSRLSEMTERPMLIIEGDLRSVRNLTSNWRAIEAALLTAVIRYNVAIYNTDDYRHTAEIIKYVAEKLPTSAPRVRETLSRLVKPKDRDLREWQLYIVQSLPGVGPKTARKLLEKFGSVKGVFNASFSELIRVEGINEEKAEKIIKIITSPYGKDAKAGKGLTEFINK